MNYNAGSETPVSTSFLGYEMSKTQCIFMLPLSICIVSFKSNQKTSWYDYSIELFTKESSKISISYAFYCFFSRKPSGIIKCWFRNASLNFPSRKLNFENTIKFYVLIEYLHFFIQKKSRNKLI